MLVYKKRFSPGVSLFLNIITFGFFELIDEAIYGQHAYERHLEGSIRLARYLPRLQQIYTQMVDYAEFKEYKSKACTRTGKIANKYSYFLKALERMKFILEDKDNQQILAQNFEISEQYFTIFPREFSKLVPLGQFLNQNYKKIQRIEQLHSSLQIAAKCWNGTREGSVGWAITKYLKALERMDGKHKSLRFGSCIYEYRHCSGGVIEFEPVVLTKTYATLHRTYAAQKQAQRIRNDADNISGDSIPHQRLDESSSTLHSLDYLDLGLEIGDTKARYVEEKITNHVEDVCYKIEDALTDAVDAEDLFDKIDNVFISR